MRNPALGLPWLSERRGPDGGERGALLGLGVRACMRGAVWVRVCEAARHSHVNADGACVGDPPGVRLQLGVVTRCTRDARCSSTPADAFDLALLGGHSMHRPWKGREVFGRSPKTMSPAQASRAPSASGSCGTCACFPCATQTRITWCGATSRSMPTPLAVTGTAHEPQPRPLMATQPEQEDSEVLVV